METKNAFKSDVKLIEVNWVNECIAGSLISAVLTVLAAYSGTQGVKELSLSQHVHDGVIAGGILMSAVCGFAAIVLALHRCLSMSDLPGDTPSPRPSFFRRLQTAKFLKIFMP
jgi:mannose/fructose/N-acetylgalactosamine-specific phosphotransferase system component IIC